MMRLMRRDNSESDSTTNRELRRLLLFVLAAGLVASIAWVVLVVSGTALNTLGQFRESVFRMVGFGSLLIAGWVIVFLFALAFRRNWFTRYNIWLASAALVAVAMGALSFLSPSEGLLGWFALGGEVTPGGRLGDMIIGNGGWTGWLRVVAALAVAGALFVLPAFRTVGDALMSLFNRRRDAGSESFAVGPQFTEDEDREDDTRITPAPVLGMSSSPTGFGVNPSSWYTSSEPVGARGAPRARPAVGSDAPDTGPSFPQPSEVFDFGSSPIRSAPVPSLANYLNGMTRSDSDSLEAGIRTALATPPEPEPEPAADEADSYGDGDPFRPLNLSKLPEPVFAFSTQSESVAVAEQAEALEIPDAPASEMSDLEEIEDHFEEAHDESEVEAADDEEIDFDADMPDDPEADALPLPKRLLASPQLSWMIPIPTEWW